MKLTKKQNQLRSCSECGKRMNSGYVIENGYRYYCSDSCLEKNMSMEDYLELYDGEGDSYWTEWQPKALKKEILKKRIFNDCVHWECAFCLYKNSKER